MLGNAFSIDSPNKNFLVLFHIKRKGRKLYCGDYFFISKWPIFDLSNSSDFCQSLSVASSNVLSRTDRVDHHILDCVWLSRQDTRVLTLCHGSCFTSWPTNCHGEWYTHTLNGLCHNHCSQAFALTFQNVQNIHTRTHLLMNTHLHAHK